MGVELERLADDAKTDFQVWAEQLGKKGSLRSLNSSTG